MLCVLHGTGARGRRWDEMQGKRRREKGAQREIVWAKVKKGCILVQKECRRFHGLSAISVLCQKDLVQMVRVCGIAIEFCPPQRSSSRLPAQIGPTHSNAFPLYLFVHIYIYINIYIGSRLYIYIFRPTRDDAVAESAFLHVTFSKMVPRTSRRGPKL